MINFLFIFLSVGWWCFLPSSGWPSDSGFGFGWHALTFDLRRPGSSSWLSISRPERRAFRAREDITVLSLSLSCHVLCLSAWNMAAKEGAGSVKINGSKTRRPGRVDASSAQQSVQQTLPKYRAGSGSLFSDGHIFKKHSSP